MLKWVVSLFLSAVFSLFLVQTALAYPGVYPGGVTVHDPGRTYDGFTLFTPMKGDNSTGNASVVYLVDMCGNLVHTWNLTYLPDFYAYLLPGGHLLYLGKDVVDVDNLQSANCTIQELDWDSNVVWEYRHPYMHHDFDRMPNGDTLVLVDEKMPPAYVSKLKGGIQGTEENGTDSHADYIMEIAPDGTIVWEWHAYQHLDPDYYTIDGLDLRDEWTHANAVQYLPAGNPFNGRESVLTSFRETDTVLILDKATGNISWVWGKGIIKHQHDPTLLPDGNVLLFDNGDHRPGFIDYSRVIEVNPKTDEINWSYSGGLAGTQFFSPIISGAQRLPNGNTLICEGMSGRIFEVTADGKIVWEYVNPYYGNSSWGNIIFRAYRYGPDEVNWPVAMPAADPLKNDSTAVAGSHLPDDPPGPAPGGNGFMALIVLGSGLVGIAGLIYASRKL